MKGGAIALYIPSLGGGGAQKVIVTLANQLGVLNERPVHVILSKRDGPFLAELRSEVTIVDLKTARASRSVWALAQYISKHQPIVLMSTLHYANIIAILAWLISGRRCRMLVREANILQEPKNIPRARLRQKLLIFAMRFLYPKVDCIVANSPDTLKSLERIGLNLGQRAVILGNPISLAKINRLPEALPWLPKPTPEFICAVGRLDYQKGFDTLIQAFASLPDKRLHLVILGEGKLRATLVSQTIALGLTERVHFPGFVRNPMSVVFRSRLFVLSSRWEGFGNVLVEALGTGVPIVATDCPGGPSWILQGGVHGHLVPFGDSVALAEGITSAMVSPAGTREGRMARAEDFAPEKIARQYLDTALLANSSSQLRQP